jgi:fermentation-respiration switch protein FrsA (DUF1100 family)
VRAATMYQASNVEHLLRAIMGIRAHPARGRERGARRDHGTELRPGRSGALRHRRAPRCGLFQRRQHRRRAFDDPRALSGAILLRAMVPLTDPPEANLDGKPVLILSGRQDPIVPADNADALASMLSRTGAKVDHRILPVGHQLSQADVALTGRWLAEATQHTTAFHDRLRHDERRP